LDSVGKSGEAGSPGGIDAAHSVVTDRQLQAAIVRADIDVGDGRVCVLGRICQRFTDDVVRADLNRFGQGCWEIDLDLDGDRRSPGQSLKRRSEPAVGQDCGVDTTRNFSQVVQRICETFGYAGELRLHLPQVLRNLRLGGTQVEQYRYEPLLDPIMEVTLNSAPGFIGRSDNSPSGRQEFVPASLQRARHGVEATFQHTNFTGRPFGQARAQVTAREPLSHRSRLTKWPDDCQVFGDDESSDQCGHQDQTADSGE